MDDDTTRSFRLMFERAKEDPPTAAYCASLAKTAGLSTVDGHSPPASVEDMERLAAAVLAGLLEARLVIAPVEAVEIHERVEH